MWFGDRRVFVLEYRVESPHFQMKWQMPNDTKQPSIQFRLIDEPDADARTYTHTNGQNRVAARSADVCF